MACSVMMSSVAGELSPVSPQASGPEESWKGGRDCIDVPRHATGGRLTRSCRTWSASKILLHRCDDSVPLCRSIQVAAGQCSVGVDGFLHRQDKSRWEFCAVINVNLANGKREHLPDSDRKLETGAVTLAGIQT